MALSGVTAARGSPPAGLSRIEKPCSPSSSSCSEVTRSTVRERRRLERQPREEAFNGLGRRLDLHHDPARVVQHVASDSQLIRQPVHVRPKAHALDGALDARARTRLMRSSTSSRSRW